MSCTSTTAVFSIDVDQAAVFYLVDGRQATRQATLVDAVNVHFTALFITPLEQGLPTPKTHSASGLKVRAEKTQNLFGNAKSQSAPILSWDLYLT